MAANYSTVRENFKEYCEKANNDAEIIFVTRKAGVNVVLLSEAAYNNLIENLFLRSNEEQLCQIDGIDRAAKTRKGCREGFDR